MSLIRTVIRSQNGASGMGRYYDEGAYEPLVGQEDPIAECARRFKTYDPASQTYIVRKGVRASCP